MAKLGDKMVIKDIDIPDENFKLLIEEQIIGNTKYRISDSYAPSLDSVESSISISYIDSKKIRDYEKVYGIYFSDDDIHSYYFICDKKGSSHDIYIPKDRLEYYNQIIEQFNKLIDSDKCEFTKKALELYDNLVNNKKMNSGGKVGI